jgi:predicted enzyme related to lactoylglutathione lyase
MARVVHFEVHADSPERAVAFYEKVFGWRFRHIPEIDYWMVMTGEGPGIDGGLLRRRGSRPTDGQAVNAFVCTLGVDDVDKSVAAATAAGAIVAVPKVPIPNIGYVAYVHDPEGNILGIYQEDAAAA